MSTTNKYDAWTPDLQVKALKRVAQSIFVLGVGVGVIAVARLLDAPIAVIVLGYIGLAVAIMIAPLVFMTSGLMAGDEPYGRLQKFTDEFCQHAINKGYKNVSLGLVVMSLVLFYVADGVINDLLTIDVTFRELGGLYVLFAALIWAFTIMRLIKADDDERLT